MLVVDIGNTHSVIGHFRTGVLVRKWRLTTIPTSTSDEVEFRVRGLLDMQGVHPDEVGGSVIATVVPSLDRTWRKALERVFPNGMVASLDHRNCGFPIDYGNPAQIGPDRLANALGVEKLGLQNAIVIDLGTATTFDVVRGGHYLGGSIAPGIETGMLALTGRTARIPQVAIEIPELATGRSTESALHSGLLLGHVGMIEYLVERIRREERIPDARVIATGGWSQMLGSLTSVIDEFHNDLTLEGLEWFAHTRLHAPPET
ncbi:MAG: type III pantothenate kinase [Fibrobacteria bacterium]|nr:type III pantothenate kinase [Fibrobacteria bacterium]